MTTPKSNPRWYHITPDRVILGMLVVQVLLFLSERFQWFPFNEKKGWTVLIAVGVVGLAVLVTLIWFVVSLCLRRRFQFGFRALLVFLVAVSIPLGWFAWEMQKARKQGEAVAAIVELRGTVTYDFQQEEHGKQVAGAEPTTPAWVRKCLGDDFFCDVRTVLLGEARYDPFGRLMRVPFGDDEAIHLRALSSLRCLRLDATEMTDKGLSHLGGMYELETLSLFGTQLTGTGLEHLKGLTNLTRLHLGETTVSNAGLAHLPKLSDLKELILPNTQVTDDGLRHLTGLTNLEFLSIGNNQITGSGLEHLKGLTKLRFLGLDSTLLTDAGLAHLREVSSLKGLSLANTQITDNSLAHLKRMTGLEILGLRNTQISPDGIVQLRQALPNCKIRHSHRWRDIRAASCGRAPSPIKNELPPLDPELLAIINGNLCEESGKYEKALSHYHEAIRLNSENADAHRFLARLLATCPDEKYRDGKKAVDHAKKAHELTHWRDCGWLDTLAAAYAEAGDFGEAVKWQEKASSMCSEDQKEDFKARLDLYKSGKPYHQEVN